MAGRQGFRGRARGVRIIVRCSAAFRKRSFFRNLFQRLITGTGTFQPGDVVRLTSAARMQIELFAELRVNLVADQLQHAVVLGCELQRERGSDCWRHRRSYYGYFSAFFDDVVASPRAFAIRGQLVLVERKV